MLVFLQCDLQHLKSLFSLFPREDVLTNKLLQLLHLNHPCLCSSHSTAARLSLEPELINTQESHVELPTSPSLIPLTLRTLPYLVISCMYDVTHSTNHCTPSNSSPLHHLLLYICPFDAHVLRFLLCSVYYPSVAPSSVGFSFLCSPHLNLIVSNLKTYYLMNCLSYCFVY